MSAISRVLAVLSVSVLLLAACASPGEPGAPTGAPTTESPDSQATASEAATDGEASVIDQWYEAAKDEGALTMYTTFEPFFIEPMIEQFVELYPGIEVEYVTFGSSELVQRVLTEARTGNQLADLVSVGDFNVYGLEQEGLFTPHDVPEADVLPAGLRRDDNLWTAIELTPAGIAWNTDLVQDPPETYDDLADPRFRERIALNPDDIDVFAPIAHFKFGGNEEAIREWLEAVAANEPTFHDGHDTTADLLAAGGIEVYGTSFFDSIQRLKADGAPIDFSLAEATVKTKVQAIFADAPHPNAALLWANFQLTQGPQQVLVDVGSLSVREDTPSETPILPEEENRFYTSVDVIEAAPIYEELWKEILGVEF